MLNFPNFVLPQTELEAEEIGVKYDLLSDLAMRNPINVPQELRIIDRYRVPAKPASCCASRPLSSRAKPTIFEFDHVESACDIVLTDPIQTGFDTWAQVWRAKLRSRRLKLESDVVIKIFQEGVWPRPYIAYRHEYDSEDLHISQLLETSDSIFWHSPSELARTEAWAYETLCPLQGSILPWSFGSYKIGMPSGEDAIGLIMEYIPTDNISLREYVISQRSDKEALWNWADTLVDTFNTIHSCGVVHLDIRVENMIMVATEPLTIVIIDFGRAEPRWIGNVDCRDKDVRDIVNVISLIDLEQPYGYYNDWLASRMERWDRFLDAFAEEQQRDRDAILATKMSCRIPPGA